MQCIFRPQNQLESNAGSEFGVNFGPTQILDPIPTSNFEWKCRDLTLMWSAKHTAHRRSKSSINPTTKETRAQISKSGITCLNKVCRASVMHPFTQIFWLYKKVKGREKKSSIWHLVKQWTLSSLIFFSSTSLLRKKG